MTRSQSGEKEMRKLFISSLILSLAVIVSQEASADVASIESNYVAGQALSVDKLNNDRTTLTNSVNNVRGVFAGGVQSSGQIKADTVGEENMADDANPRIRTYEGASCSDLVVTGLLPSTSASLVGSIPAGTAYPDGYRVDKTSSTAKVFTASKWTFVYLLSSGSFSYSEVAIGAATPTAPANSALLARVSTDTTTINTVSDLRTVNCTSGPFSDIADATNEATLEDLLTNGTVVRKNSVSGITPQGFVQGLVVSWNTHTTFKVTAGSAYINGKYRVITSDQTITTGADDPTTGTSGIDTGSVTGGPVNYYVYGIADQSEVNTASITYSLSSTAPSGVSNYRFLGKIRTDATNLFTSENVSTVHSISEREVVSGEIDFNGSGTVAINKSFNVSALTDNGTGDYTVTWENDFDTAYYSCLVTSGPGSALGGYGYVFAKAVGTAQVRIANPYGAGLEDSASISVIAIGE